MFAIMRTSKLLKTSRSSPESPASATLSSSAPISDSKSSIGAAAGVRYNCRDRRSSGCGRRSIHFCSSSRSRIRPAVTFDTSSCEATSVCDKPSLSRIVAITRHCARVSPRLRARESNRARCSRAIQEIRNGIENSGTATSPGGGRSSASSRDPMPPQRSCHVRADSGQSQGVLPARIAFQKLAELEQFAGRGKTERRRQPVASPV